MSYASLVGDHVATQLPGPLMLAILGALWRDDLTFTRLHATLNKSYKPIAMSTLSTTLTRLIERKWILRIHAGYYAAGITRDELKAVLTAAIDEA